MKVKLPKIAKTHPIAFWVAVVLHLVLLLGLVYANVQSWEAPKPAPKKNKVVPKAITVDLTEIKKEKQRLADNQKKREDKLKALERAEKKVENERYKEQQRLKTLKEKVKQEKKAKKIADQKAQDAEKRKNLADQKAQDAEKRKELADQKAQDAEKRKNLADQKAKDAEKRKKLADQKAQDAEKRKNLADQKAKDAQQKKQVIEKQGQEEAKKFATEQDRRALTQEVQAEEDQDRQVVQEEILSKLKASYINQIAARVKSQWRYQGAKDDWSCNVYIVQDIEGKVSGVNLKSCHVDDSAKAQSFKDAIERAVYKAEPLPSAPDKSVFDREILFHFKVN